MWTLPDPAVVAGHNLLTDNLLTDNPELYEAVFPDPSHDSGRFVDGIIQRYAGRPAHRVLDLGCGTGRDAGYLARRGYEVVGLDASPHMLRHARAHHPEVSFVPGRMESFSLGSTFDVISCLDSSMLYCHTNEALAGMLADCHRHLVPGGLLVAEMRNGAYFLGTGAGLAAPADVDVTWQGIRYRAQTELSVDHAAQLLRRRRTWTWTGRDAPLVQESAWRLLFPQELRYLLVVAGFEVRELFDTPGPHTVEPWRDDAPLGRTLRGNRLQVVAIRSGTT